MRAWLAIAAGLGIGAGIAWWLSKDGPDPGNERRGARRTSTSVGTRPSLYRWRDDAGVLQITEKPPRHRPFERIDRETAPGIRVSGEPADTER